MFLFPLKRVLFSFYLFVLVIVRAPPCPICHTQVPEGPPVPYWTHIVTIVHRITLWIRFFGERNREREKERETVSPTHTRSHSRPPLPPCAKEDSRVLLNFSRVTGSFRIDGRESFQVCGHESHVAMLDKELYFNLFSVFIIIRFLSLATWSPRRDEAMGSCVRFEDRGLFFWSHYFLLLLLLSGFSWQIGCFTVQPTIYSHERSPLLPDRIALHSWLCYRTRRKAYFL